MCRFVGGLFEKGEDAVEMAFRYAVDRINADNKILPHTRLVAQVEQLEKFDSFSSSKKGNWMPQDKIRSQLQHKTL